MRNNKTKSTATYNIKLITLLTSWIAVNIPALAVTNMSTIPSISTTPIQSSLVSKEISYKSLIEMAKSGQLDQAITLAKLYLAKHDDNDIRILYARMLGWNKQYDPAREQLYYSLSQSPGNYDALDALSDIESWTLNYPRALDYINSGLAKYPNDSHFSDKKELITLKIQIQSGNKELAIKNAMSYLNDKQALNLRMYLAKLYTQDKRYVEAKAQLYYVLNKEPDSIDAINQLAEVEIVSGNYKNALSYIDHGLMFAPKQTELLIKKQLVLDILHQTLSLPSFIPPIFLNSQSTEVTYVELQKMAQSNQRSKAIQLAEKSLKKNDNLDIRVLLGQMLAWDKQYPQARAQLNYVLTKKPNNIDASLALANVELWSNHKEQALKIIEKALKYNPKDAFLLKARENILTKAISYQELKKLIRLKQIDKAIQLAREYLKIKEDLDVRTLLGILYSRIKNYENAKTQFQMVLNKNPNYTDASIGLANVEIWSGNYNQALITINNALKYTPNNQDLLKQKKQTMQGFTQTTLNTGLSNTGNLVGPNTLGGKLNAITVANDTTYVDDLKQYWRDSFVSYTRYTPFLGPVILTARSTHRFNTPGSQYTVEAFPPLFNKNYAFIAYGYSRTSYLPQNFYQVEPYFVLPKSYELSLGIRTDQFKSNTIHLYTVSLSKYIGNYLFTFRHNHSNLNNKTDVFTARQYFSSPLSYVSIVVSKGSGPSNFDMDNPNSITAKKSASITINGNYPFTNEWILSWLGNYSKEHFTNNRTRISKTVFTGLIWRF